MGCGLLIRSDKRPVFSVADSAIVVERGVVDIRDFVSRVKWTGGAANGLSL